MIVALLKEHLDKGLDLSEVEVRALIDQAARASDVLSQNEHDRFARCTVHLLEAMRCLRSQ